MAKVKVSEERLSQISELRKHIICYIKTRDVYSAYRKAGYSRRFYEEHKEEIIIHKAAKKAFDALPEKKIPKVREVNDEFQKVLSEKRATYSEYKKERDRAKEILIVQENIRSLYEAEETSLKQNRQKDIQH